jgi:glycosyltransferase involved in cell wall biosynthesis
VPTAGPTFSIVIAAYQVADVIADALHSALAQTHRAHEVIVCDDGSTDGLDAALSSFGDSITLIKRSVNGGEAAAKNQGVRAATAEFVVILDADDVFMPDRLEALAQLAAARPDLDILTTDAYLELEGTRIRRCYEADWPFETDDQRRGILERNFIFGLAAVRRQRLLDVGGFDESIRWTTDWDCWIRLILHGSRAGAVAEPLALYRVRAGSLSAARRDHVAGRLQTLRKAASTDGLSVLERRTVNVTIAEQERELALLEARSALLAGDAHARRRLLAVARRNGIPARTRAKAAIAALVPGLAARALRDRDEGSWTGAGGIQSPSRHSS